MRITRARVDLLMRAALAVGLLQACSGSAPGSEAPIPGVPGQPPVGAPVVDPRAMPPSMMPPSSNQQAAPRIPGFVEGRIWRLTRKQYNNTISDLAGDTTQPASTFLHEEGGTGFTNAELSLGISVSHLSQFQLAAQKVAIRVTGAPDRLAKVFPCGAAKLNDDGCMREFVVTFGRRAYRRPLGSDEVDGYLAMHARAKAQLDVAEAFRLVLQTILQSPNFLFRAEIGDGKPDARGLVRLTSHEMAAALSYTLWNTMPDPVLSAAADKGELVTAEQVGAHARRMIDDPRARPAFTDFFLQLLDYEKLDEITKVGGAGDNVKRLRPLWLKETTMFIEEVVWKEQGASLATLLTAPYTFLDGTMDFLYGITLVGDEFRKVMVPTKDRAGLLTHTGLMAITSSPAATSPIQRGKFIAERLLCVELPDPPPEVMAQEPPPDTAKTTRQRYEQHLVSPSCRACHHLMDEPGFAFEHIGIIGENRPTENGIPVKTSGTLAATRDIDGAFANVGDLARKLGSSQQVRECFAQQMFRYAGGRLERMGDETPMGQLMTRFEKSDWSLKELLLAYLASDRFSLRAR